MLFWFVVCGFMLEFGFFIGVFVFGIIGIVFLFFLIFFLLKGLLNRFNFKFFIEGLLLDGNLLFRDVNCLFEKKMK